MSIFPFAKKKKEAVSAIALDIGTEFVKCIICEVFPHEKKIEVIGTAKQRQSLGDTQAGAILDIASVLENCEMAIHSAEKEAGIKPTQMIIGIGGELIKGKSTTVNIKRENPEQKIDLSELKNIVHKVQWKAFEQIRSQLAIETGHEEIEIKLVNAAITKVEIDGQMASNPVGFQGKDMTLNIFNSFAPLTHFGAMQTIAAELQRDLLGIVAQPYAISRALSEEDGGDLSAVFIDVGGGTTDVAIVENGAILGMKTFGLGGRTFTKRLSISLNISFREAEKIKMAYAEGKLEKRSAEIVSEAMCADAEVWLTGLELTLKEYNYLETIPSRILLCGGGSKLPEIKNTLEGKSWFKDIHFTQKPRVQFLEPKDISIIHDLTGSIKGSEDISPLALANLTIDLAGEEPVMQKILRNMTSLIQN